MLLNKNDIKKTVNFGFTIVELLIVIVVIGILAAITVVAYTGIQSQAAAAALKSDLTQSKTKLDLYKVTNSDQYPSTEQDVKDLLGLDPNTKIEYTPSSNDKVYCLTVSSNQAKTAYHLDSTTGAIAEGACTGHDGYVAGGGGGEQGPFEAITAGLEQTCAIASGKPYCWGWDESLGIQTSTRRLVPVAIDTSGVLSGKTVTAISSGRGHTCAIASGQAFCWGMNNNGQLGNNSTTASTVPVAVNTSGVLSGKTVTDISAGENFTCAIASGQAFCWGNNGNGNLGNNSTTASTVPVAVNTSGVLSGKTVTDISAGGTGSGVPQACAVASGQAYCWGNNALGQLGDNSTTSSSVPVAVNASGVLSSKTVTSISAGKFHNCAIASGQAFCWGYNNYGSLGNNSTDNSLIPVAVDVSGVLSGKTLTSISTGGNYACVTVTDNDYCWGYGANGNLGDSLGTNSSVPVAVDTSGVLSGKTATSVAAGNDHACTIASGQAYCWGINGSGQLGNNTTSYSLIPVQVSSLPS